VTAPVVNTDLVNCFVVAEVNPATAITVEVGGLPLDFYSDLTLHNVTLLLVLTVFLKRLFTAGNNSASARMRLFPNQLITLSGRGIKVNVIGFTTKDVSE
jgi:hypothetical protein